MASPLRGSFVHLHDRSCGYNNFWLGFQTGSRLARRWRHTTRRTPRALYVLQGDPPIPAAYGISRR
eukprot:scaffold693_cov200-Alexandrium_tamarense.AAC.67